MSGSKDLNRKLRSSHPKTPRHGLTQAGNPLPGSPEEVVALVSHEISEFRDKLRTSPTFQGSTTATAILETMSKLSLPRQSPLECFSPTDCSSLLSLRELHTGLSRAQVSPYISALPIDTERPPDLNGICREARQSSKASAGFNSTSLPCIAASSLSEGSGSGHGGNMSDRSSDFFTSSHVTSGTASKAEFPAANKDVRPKPLREPLKQVLARPISTDDVQKAVSVPRKSASGHMVIPAPTGPGQGKFKDKDKERDFQQRSRYVIPQLSGHTQAKDAPRPAGATHRNQQNRQNGVKNGVVNKTAVVDSSGWFCGCRPVDQTSPYSYREEVVRKGGLQHPYGGNMSRSVFGSFIKKLKSSPTRLLKPPSPIKAACEPEQHGHLCKCSSRQVDGSVAVAVAVEAEFRKMAHEHEERMKNMQESVEDMMRTIAGQLQQLEVRTSVSVDNEQMRRFWSANGEANGTWDKATYQTGRLTGLIPSAHDVLKYADSVDSTRFPRVVEPFQPDRLARLVAPDPVFDDNPDLLSPLEPPSLLEWQQSPSGSSRSSIGAIPSLNRLILEKATRDTRQALHAFTECLVAGQDPDSVCDIVNQLLPRVRFVKPYHARYGLESCIAGAFFSDFDEPFCGVGHHNVESEGSGWQPTAKDCWEAYQRVADANPRDIINDRHPSSDKSFHYFCQAKLKLFQDEVKWVSKWSVNLLNTFLEAAIGVWRLHLLSLSFEPSAVLIHASQFEDYSPEYMELVDSDVGTDGNSIVDDHVFSPSVEFTVMPGFKTLDGYVRCQVYLKVRTRTRTERHMRQLSL